MAKPASELTLAIRSLCDETDGTITHAQVRPRLKELGFEIVEDPGRQSAELTKWNEYEVDLDDPESISATANACKFDEETLTSVLNESKLRFLFKKERNNFDVTKNIWKKAKESGKMTASRKPVSPGPNSRAQAAAAAAKTEPVRPRRQTSAPSVLQSSEEMEALTFIEANGGMSAVEGMLADARKNVSELEKVLGLVEELTKRITAAA